MANYRPAAAVAASADWPGRQSTPPVEVTALCDLGQCARCPGEIVSLLVAPGTRCGHGCHRKEVAA